MDTELKEKGLVLVAPEVWGTDKKRLRDFAKDKGIGYTITEGIKGPKIATGVPHMAVFDATGKMVFSGHPNGAKSAITKALDELNAGTEPEPTPAEETDLVPLRDWTNSDGKTIKATLIDVSGTTGAFKFANGKIFEYDITKLSAADQADIKKAQEAAVIPAAE